MSIWPSLPLAVVAVLFFRELLLRRYQIVPFCDEVHQVGPILLKHYVRVPCDLALQVVQYAQWIWEELRA